MIYDTIYHLSDIHIPVHCTDRYDEYAQVFRRLYRTLKKHSSSALIVITGDVIHTRNDLIPEALEFVNEFFTQLSSVAPVIIIPGNHDCPTHHEHKQDTLSILFKHRDMHNLHYFKASGTYIVSNVVFGVTSIFDDHVHTLNKVKHDLKIKIKKPIYVALYHGQLTHLSKFKTADFQNYHLGLFGDVHDHTMLNDHCGYAGSLIQQSHRENYEHGMLRWNLNSRTATFVPIINDYGFRTLIIRHDKAQKVPWAKYTHLRCNVRHTSEVMVQSILSKIKRKHVILSIKIFHDNKTQEQIILHPRKKLEQYLLHKHVSDEHVKAVMAIHDKMKIRIPDFEEFETGLIQSKPFTTWQIQTLSFSNVFCYGENNVISFRDLDKASIIGLFANNQSGKTALLDILLFALFERTSRTSTKNIIHTQSKSMSIQLCFLHSGKEYTIEKIGKRSRTGLTIQIISQIYECDAYGKHKMAFQNKSEANAFIQSLVGKYDHFVHTHAWLSVSEDAIPTFAHMSNAQKQEHLNAMFNFHVLEASRAWIKNKLERLKFKIDQVRRFAPPESNAAGKAAIQSNIDKAHKRRANMEQASKTMTHMIYTQYLSEQPFDEAACSRVLKIIHDQLQSIDHDLILYQQRLQIIQSQPIMTKAQYESLHHWLARQNIYQIYAEALQYRGLPYELVKTFIPHIERMMNAQLAHITHFTVKLIADKQDVNQKVSLRSGSLALYMQSNDQLLLASSGSGFEIFVMELALRTSLYKLMNLPKPNFMIMDEGWNCLDTQNVQNLNHVLQYLTLQYDYIILLNHRTDLQHHVNVRWCIEKQNEYNHLQTHDCK